jgi:hypothetical protein
MRQVRSFSRYWLALLVQVVASPLVLATDFVWPTPNTAFERGQGVEAFVQPTASGRPESALFGCVRNNGKRFHEGLDLAPVQARKSGRATDAILASHAGKVVHINRIAGNSSYGIYVVLEHPSLDVPIYSLYSHLRWIEPALRVGSKLKAGDRIGIMGNTAGGYHIPLSRSHLHFEVGLRLGGGFDAWYERQEFGSPNHHGSYNGMNLVGWDPLDYARYLRRNPKEGPLAYISTLPPMVCLQVAVVRRPDFLNTYPALELAGVPPALRSGWEVYLTEWGLPVAMRAVSEGQLQGLGSGQVRIKAVRSGLSDTPCRHPVRQRGEQIELTASGRQVIELLFSR